MHQIFLLIYLKCFIPWLQGIKSTCSGQLRHAAWVLTLHGLTHPGTDQFISVNMLTKHSDN